MLLRATRKVLIFSPSMDSVVVLSGPQGAGMGRGEILVGIHDHFLEGNLLEVEQGVDGLLQEKCDQNLL